MAIEIEIVVDDFNVKFNNVVDGTIADRAIFNRKKYYPEYNIIDEINIRDNKNDEILYTLDDITHVVLINDNRTGGLLLLI